MATPLARHNIEIAENLANWERKPLLREIYRNFHTRIARYIRSDLPGLTVELGSGIGNIKEVIPQCLRTDLFPNPWLDRIENAYKLSFADGSVANIILFDVFHHLELPGRALREFGRVLLPGGRVVIFEPCMSLLGLFVYGVFHHEPLGLTKAIVWDAQAASGSAPERYYAAQGNAWRIFIRGEHRAELCGWKIMTRERFSALSYVASGGYSKPQLYPDSIYPFMRKLDAFCDRFPLLFATRLLVVLEKGESVRAHV